MEIVTDTPDVVIGWHAPVVLVWWRRTPVVATAQLSGEVTQRLMQQFGVGVVLVVLSQPTVGVPDRAASDLMGKNTRALEKYIVAHAFVIEGTGLKASAIRQSVKMLQSFTRVIFPWTIAATAEEGILWIARKAKFLSEEEAQFLLKEIKAMRDARPG